MTENILCVSEKELAIIKSILSKYPYTFYAFGSRVKNTHKKYSDLDLCYKENIPDSDIAYIREAFDESALPYKVDIVSWQRCEPEFQKHIEMDLVEVTA